MESRFQECKMMSRLKNYIVTNYDDFMESFVAFSSSNLAWEQTTLVNKSKTTLIQKLLIRLPQKQVFSRNVNTTSNIVDSLIMKSIFSAHFKLNCGLMLSEEPLNSNSNIRG